MQVHAAKSSGWHRPATGVPADRALLQVLTGLMALSVITQAIQWLSMAVAGIGGTIVWWVVNLAFLLALVGLRMRVQRGDGPHVALGLVALLTALALALLVADGTDNSVWPVVAGLGLAIAALRLSLRGMVAVAAVQVVLCAGVVLLHGLDVLEPLDAREGQTPLSALSTVAVLLVVALLAFVVRRAAERYAVPAPVDVPRVRTASLSAREAEITGLVAAGHTNAQIAERLTLSPRTVQTHVANAMRKTGTANRTELGVVAVREGLAPE